MIRVLQEADIDRVAEIWLDSNLKAHYFIPEQYWKSNFEAVKEMLSQAEVYVYEDARNIQGFTGLNDEYIEGVFVSDEMQSQGIGKMLLDYVKSKKAKLLLNVIKRMYGLLIFIEEKASKSNAKVWINLPVKKIM